MFSSHPAEFLLETTCRTLTSLPSDDKPRFAVGTSLVREPNHLFLLQYDSDVNEIILEASIETENAVKCFASCHDRELLLVAAEYRSNVTLYKLPTPTAAPNDVDNGSPELQELQILQTESTIGQIKWRKPQEQTADVMTIDQIGNLQLWDLQQNTVIQQRHVDTGIWKPTIAFDPHNEAASALACGDQVQLFDWRTDAPPVGTVSAFRAHRHGVTDIDYNPNKPFVLATAGQDALIKFWDLRQAKHPLLVGRGAHSHWVTNVKYNPAHDQLVLSTGTDAMSNLWRISTISSSPLLVVDGGDDDDADDHSESAAPDVRVESYEHNESIYGACWAASDPWIYMTLGYDGKLVLNHVPSKEKYKILL